MFNIEQFKTQGLTYGGARPTLFQVELVTPFASQSGATAKFSFACRASQVPPSSIESINVPYFGRKVKVAGDRTFPDWSVTIMNDEDFLVRNMFEQWSNYINSHVGNLKTLVGNTYKSNDALVTQFSKDGDAIKSYRFASIWPNEVGAMELDWDSTNTIQNFPVTFSYDYWEPITTSGLIIDTGGAGQLGTGR